MNTGECEEEVVTCKEFMQRIQEDLGDLQALDCTECSYEHGYVTQNVFACLTCNGDTKFALCYGCW